MNEPKICLKKIHMKEERTRISLYMRAYKLKCRLCIGLNLINKHIHILEGQQNTMFCMFELATMSPCQNVDLQLIHFYHAKRNTTQPNDK